jgi:orotate phosphoribosyltransferase
MEQSNILQEFKDAEAILRGHFILSSGLHSDTYLQCARVLMDPKMADRLCNALAKKVTKTLGSNSIDMIVAPAMGGVVVGYEMGRQLGLTSIFCERVEGKFEIRRGFSIEKGAKILVIEDVVTTGKSSLETMDCIHDHGGVVVAEACLIDRSNGTSNLGVPLISLLELEVQTYSEDKLPPELQSKPAIKPGSRWLNKKAG